MNVKLHPAERFMNYMIHHTDLYTRKKKGKEVSAKELFAQLRPFFDELEAEIRLDERAQVFEERDQALARVLKKRGLVK